MKSFGLVFSLAACAALAAQTAPTASKTAKAPATAAHHISSTTAGTGASTAAFPVTYKLPADEHRLPTPQKKVAVLTYQDIKVGTGAEGEAGKLWHVKYKGWRASDGVVFDSWENNRRPVTGEDGKPVMGPDNTPKLAEPEPLVFPQGVGRLIPGFDYGVMGMRIGGKRRLFIPWQMAYGNRAMPDRPDHPGIPAKSDLIFDIELVDVTDMPQQQRPMMPPTARPGQPGAAGQPGATAHPNPPVEGKPVQPDAANPDAAKPAQPQTSQPAQPQTNTPQPK